MCRKYLRICCTSRLSAFATLQRFVHVPNFKDKFKDMRMCRTSKICACAALEKYAHLPHFKKIYVITALQKDLRNCRTSKICALPHFKHVCNCALPYLKDLCIGRTDTLTHLSKYCLGTFGTGLWRNAFISADCLENKLAQL
jgi:hypothetical protein